MRVLEIKREVSREELQETIKKRKASKRQTWLEILLFVLDCWQGKEVAEFLNLHPITVNRVVDRFNTEGWEGLYCCCQGRPSGIPSEAETEVIVRLEQALYADLQHQEVIRGALYKSY